MRAQRAPDGPAVLPCQNRNNSTGDYRFYHLPDSENCVQSGDGRAWACVRPGAFWNMDDLSSSERKAAFQLRGNLDSFVETWGQKHCAFWTLTDLEGITPREFARRWNSEKIKSMVAFRYLLKHGEKIDALILTMDTTLAGFFSPAREFECEIMMDEIGNRIELELIALGLFQRLSSHNA